MKKTTWVATAMGLALVFGTAMKSEAFCLLGCDDSTQIDQKAAGRDIRENSDNVTGQSAKGIGNQALHDATDSVVVNHGDQNNMGNSVSVGGDVKGQMNANNMNSIGGVDKSHNNSFDSHNSFGR